MVGTAIDEIAEVAVVFLFAFAARGEMRFHGGVNDLFKLGVLLYKYVLLIISAPDLARFWKGLLT